jgi:hypothetical protein
MDAVGMLRQLVTLWPICRNEASWTGIYENKVVPCSDVSRSPLFWLCLRWCLF